MKITVKGDSGSAMLNLRFEASTIAHEMLFKIVADDASGKPWVLFFVGQTGAFKRLGAISKETGWPLDERGRINLVE